MKQLKTSLDDLRRIFTCSITARDLAEPLASFDAMQTAETIRVFMEQKDYDAVGVRKDGLVIGFVERSALSEGLLGDHLLKMHRSSTLPDSSTIAEVLKSLVESPRIFIAGNRHVWGIITRGDLQKVPVRMYLFGLVSLLEMRLLEVIRESHANDAWFSFLSMERVDRARTILDDRRRRNEATDLADCLQFADKTTIVAKSDAVRDIVGFDSPAKARANLKEVEDLRNDLAHAQDIIAGRWPRLVELSNQVESILERCESHANTGQEPV